MNTQALLEDIRELQDRFTVRFNPDAGAVDLERVVFPPGWTPRTGTIRHAVPDNYKASPPTVHISEEMRFQGKKPRRMRKSRFEGYKRWCVTFDWDPRRHGLVSVTRVMMNHSLPEPSRRKVAMP